MDFLKGTKVGPLGLAGDRIPEGKERPQSAPPFPPPPPPKSAPAYNYVINLQN